MTDYMLDEPSEPDGCARWARGDCDCMPGHCDVEEEIAIRDAEGERDYPETEWDTDRECGQ